jgi:2-oxoglutarate dehydrogenase E1 component
MGAKTFSLEGGESIIPALDTLIERAAEMGVEQFVMGMAHRGRLNILANIFGKIYTRYFRRIRR